MNAHTLPPLPPAPPFAPNAEVRRATEANQAMLKAIARSQAARSGLDTCDIEVDPDGVVVRVGHVRRPRR